MADETPRTAAEVMWDAIDDKGIRGRLFREDCDYLADMLAAAGLLVTAEHDAQVLRDAADDWGSAIHNGGGGSWLRARADRIATGAQP